MDESGAGRETRARSGALQTGTAKADEVGRVDDETLWRQIRSGKGQGSSRQREERRASFVVAFVALAIAIGALIVGSLYGAVHPSIREFPSYDSRVRAQAFAFASAGVVLVAGVVATRRLAGNFGHIIAARTVTAAGAAIRLLTALVGYVVVLISVLGLLDVSLGRLLTDATLVGVVLGIAAQQTLGNVFAGLVLLLARPFTVGDAIRVRSGAMGGLFNGVVLGMSLTYVTMSTDDGLLKVPNSGMLAAAVGPYRPPAPPSPALSIATTGGVPVTGATTVIPEPGTDTRPPPGSDAPAQPGEGGALKSPWRELAARDNRRREDRGRA